MANKIANTVNGVTKYGSLNPIKYIVPFNTGNCAADNTI